MIAVKLLKYKKIKRYEAMSFISFFVYTNKIYSKINKF